MSLLYYSIFRGLNQVVIFLIQQMFSWIVLDHWWALLVLACTSVSELNYFLSSHGFIRWAICLYYIHVTSVMLSCFSVGFYYGITPSLLFDPISFMHCFRHSLFQLKNAVSGRSVNSSLVSGVENKPKFVRILCLEQVSSYLIYCERFS